MVEEYAALLRTYKRMFGMVDAFHFNSQNTAEVYGQYLDVPEASRVIPITHSDIQDHRRRKIFDEGLLRIGFIGNDTPYKGLPMLKEVIARLNAEGLTDKIVLSVYGGRTDLDEKVPNVKYKGRFTSSMLGMIYDEMDLLVVPSIWHETFSLVTMEALSFGTPVLASDHVGAKDLVKQYDVGFVFHSEDDLYGILKRLVSDRRPLRIYNGKILAMPWAYSMERHTKEIVNKMY